MQTCKYSNSDDESACWMTAQYNSLERYITCISNFFSSDSGITFALRSLDLLTNQTGKTKDMIILFKDSITEATAGSNIPSDTMKIMSCSD